MPKEILIRHPVTQHVLPKPYANGLYVWKCRSCAATLPDDGKSGLHLCPVDHEVMDYTPVKKDYHGGK